MHPFRLPLAALVLGAALLAAGCSPISFSMTLGPGDRRLRETPVITESNRAKVALIDVRGLIADARQSSLFAGGLNPVDELTARLRKAEKDDRVRAIVLRINSPGGTVTGSDIMYREVRAFAERTSKPVVASLGEVAASGGYYLALSADEIVAQPTSITGSIGVIIPTLNVSQGLGRIGIVSRSVTSGANKDIANPLEPIREGQYAVLQGIVDDFYARFKGLVLERRPALAPADAADATDGRILTGARALELGLVDSVGGVREAFDAAKRRAGLTAATLVKYYAREDPRPTSPYADAPPTGPEINLLQLHLGSAPGAGAESPGVYYLWIPPGW